MDSALQPTQEEYSLAVHYDNDNDNDNDNNTGNDNGNGNGDGNGNDNDNYNHIHNHSHNHDNTKVLLALWHSSQDITHSTPRNTLVRKGKMSISPFHPLLCYDVRFGKTYSLMGTEHYQHIWIQGYCIDVYLIQRELCQSKHWLNNRYDIGGEHVTQELHTYIPT